MMEPVTQAGPVSLPANPKRILVACIGNIFLGDDGFGVEVAQRLAGRAYPAGVKVVDFGIQGLGLAHALLEAAARHRSTRPADALAVLVELGLVVQRQRWSKAVQMIGENGPEAVGRIARRLCLPADRHEELAELLARTPPPVERDVVTLWWDR